MKAYISGPMTGIKGHNYRDFQNLCTSLRKGGYDVFDPTELFGGRTDLPWEHYMRHCIAGVFTCDRVFALRGWRESTGARVEIAVALSSGIPVYEIDLEIQQWVRVGGGRDRVSDLIGVQSSTI